MRYCSSHFGVNWSNRRDAELTYCDRLFVGLLRKRDKSIADSFRNKSINWKTCNIKGTRFTCYIIIERSQVPAHTDIERRMPTIASAKIYLTDLFTLASRYMHLMEATADRSKWIVSALHRERSSSISSYRAPLLRPYFPFRWPVIMSWQFCVRIELSEANRRTAQKGRATQIKMFFLKRIFISFALALSYYYGLWA